MYGKIVTGICMCSVSAADNRNLAGCMATDEFLPETSSLAILYLMQPCWNRRQTLVIEACKG